MMMVTASPQAPLQGDGQKNSKKKKVARISDPVFRSSGRLFSQRSNHALSISEDAFL
jgi:hypothetical protein